MKDFKSLLKKLLSNEIKVELNSLILNNKDPTISFNEMEEYFTDLKLIWQKIVAPTTIEPDKSSLTVLATNLTVSLLKTLKTAYSKLKVPSKENYIKLLLYSLSNSAKILPVCINIY